MGHPVYLVEGKRTPFAKYGGAFLSLDTLELSYLAAKAVLEHVKVSPDTVDQVIVANVIPPTAATLYCARHLALKLGMPVHTPAHMVNRLCGSGLEAIIQARRLIETGEAEAILVAGVENMSLIPHLLYGARFGTKYGNLPMSDFLLDTLSDKQAQIPMGETAENVAVDHKIDRETSDQYSFQSHTKAAQAWKRGLLAEEVIEVQAGKLLIKKDEHVREDISLADLAKLKPHFKAGGVVTAGSASGVVDGAAAVLIASESYVKKHGLKPLAQLGLSDVVGVDPKRMGIGPVPAIQNLLSKMNTKISQVDLLEINEAFAPQALGCFRALDYPLEQSNIWGGAVAIGHPLGATGIRLAMTLARQLKMNKLKTGIASACIGGGQGIALEVRSVGV